MYCVAYFKNNCPVLKIKVWDYFSMQLFVI